MDEEKLLTVREVSLALGISEKEVMDLAESGALPAYKVGGLYLRFKREQIDELKKAKRKALVHKKSGRDLGYAFKDKVSDLLYFNDFYILSVLVIGILLFIIFRG